jgi:hypothetical protein
MQSKITAGETVVTLNGEDLVLRPTLRAVTQISRLYGGLAKARAELVAENLDAVVTILRLGTGMSDRDAKDLGERVYQNGITAQLLVALIKYVAVLGNGGKPLPDEPVDSAAQGDGETGAGNF